MSSAYPAIKGKMGTNEYYVVTMNAKEAVSFITLPDNMSSWPNRSRSIEEQYQRKLNFKRVKNQIYPYLVTNNDRFFGSLVVAVEGLSPKSFTPISKFSHDDLLDVHKIEIENIGILTLKNDGKAVALDGQHRLAGLEFAISNKDEKGKSLGHVLNDPKIEKDRISVILIPLDVKDDSKKARRIFTRLNRYAKSTSTSQNLITDDDDSIASISRWITNNVINTDENPELVNWERSSLSSTDEAFTTLDTIYKCNTSIIREEAPEQIKKDKPLSSREYKHYLDLCKGTWEFLIENIEVFKDALLDKTPDGNKKRIEIRKVSLLGKPVPQQCLVDAFLILTRQNSGIAKKEAAKRLNKVPWNIGDPLWDRLLWLGDKDKGKILTKGKRIATEIVVYMCGGPTTPDKESVLLKDYRSLFPEKEGETKKLPDTIV